MPSTLLMLAYQRTENFDFVHQVPLALQVLHLLAVSIELVVAVLAFLGPALSLDVALLDNLDGAVSPRLSLHAHPHVTERA